MVVQIHLPLWRKVLDLFLSPRPWRSHLFFFPSATCTRIGSDAPRAEKLRSHRFLIGGLRGKTPMMAEPTTLSQWLRNARGPWWSNRSAQGYTMAPPRPSSWLRHARDKLKGSGGATGLRPRHRSCAGGRTRKAPSPLRPGLDPLNSLMSGSASGPTKRRLLPNNTRS